MLLLCCRNVEIPLNIFIGCINRRLEHLFIPRKWEQAAFFNNRCGLSFFFFWLALYPGVTCVTFYDWSAAHSSNNRCNSILHRGLELGIERTIMKRTLLDFSFSLSKQKSKRWCQWRTMVRRLRMFRLALQCRFRQFEKVPNFMLGQVLSYLTFKIEVQYMFTLICHAVSVFL